MAILTSKMLSTTLWREGLLRIELFTIQLEMGENDIHTEM